MKVQDGQNASLIFPFGQLIASSLLLQRRLQLAGTFKISKNIHNLDEPHNGQAISSSSSLGVSMQSLSN
jgi:hypothetical protein